MKLHYFTRGRINKKNNYSLNKTVEMMYRIKALIPWKEKSTFWHFIYEVLKRSSFSHHQTESRLHNVIMTSNDKCTLCNYLLPF